MCTSEMVFFLYVYLSKCKNKPIHASFGRRPHQYGQRCWEKMWIDHCSNVPNTFIINQLGTRDLFNRSWENNLLLFILQSK